MVHWGGRHRRTFEFEASLVEVNVNTQLSKPYLVNPIVSHASENALSLTLHIVTFMATRKGEGQFY